MRELIIISAISIAFGAFGGYKIGMMRYNALKADFSDFKEKSALLAAEAEKNAKIESSRLENLREEANAAYTEKINNLNADIKRLRAQRTSSGYLPAATKAASSTNRICFDRSQLDRALSAFGDGAAGIIAEGDHYRIGLDTAKTWAQGLDNGQKKNR